MTTFRVCKVHSESNIKILGSFDMPCSNILSYTVCFMADGSGFAPIDIFVPFEQKVIFPIIRVWLDEDSNPITCSDNRIDYPSNRIELMISVGNEEQTKLFPGFTKTPPKRIIDLSTLMP
jgi:hypothetical protein